MINELDESIRHLLTSKGGLDPAEVDIRFEIPDRDWAAGISKPTINCYLYDIHENRQLRETDWIVERNGHNSKLRRHAPWRIDLSYLITAWTKAVEDEHRLLWQVLVTLFRHRLIPTEALQGALVDTDVPIPTSVAQPESALSSPGEFWSALENKLKPSLNYVVTLPLDPEAVSIAPMVFGFQLRTTMPPSGRPAGTTDVTGVVRGADGEIISTARVFFVGANPGIGGDVYGRGGEASGRGRAGAGSGGGSDRAHGVSRSGSGLDQSLVTACDGSFTFEGLAPGRYRVAVVIPGQPPREQELVVPSENYDLVIPAEE